MDRPLDPRFRRRQWIKRTGVVALGLSLLAGVFVYLPGWIRPALDRDRIRTARVEVGAVEATITASGTVVPEFEQLLSSPISSRVVRVLERPGALLEKGQPIVELDLSQAMLAVEKLGEERALKENQQAALELELERQLKELDARWRLKDLELQNLTARAQQYQKLLEWGTLSKDQARGVGMEKERAAIELQQLEEEQQHARESTRVQLEGLDLERRILQREQEEARRRLEQAQIRAEREGVLTWVIPQEGASVSQGEVVARMADLSSFRVEAAVSEIHVGRLGAGLPVKVGIEEGNYLRGSIARILPTIENGIAHLEVGLEERADKRLRANRRVEVYIVLEQRERTLRIRKGAALSGGGIGEVQVFAVRGDRAFRTPVRLGIAGFDYCEVLEGLMEGDEVVISEVKDYIHMEEVEIK